MIKTSTERQTAVKFTRVETILMKILDLSARTRQLTGLDFKLELDSCGGGSGELRERYGGLEWQDGSIRNGAASRYSIE